MAKGLGPILLLGGAAVIYFLSKKREDEAKRAEPPIGGECASLGPLEHEGEISGWLVDDGNGGCRIECEPGYVLSEDGEFCVPEE